MDKFSLENLEIYRDVFKYIDSNMYIIVENNEALIIDPHYNNDILRFLKEKNVEKITVILTHEHPDHISGLKNITDKFDSFVIAPKETADYIADIKNTRPILINFILEEKDKENGTNLLEDFNSEYEAFAYDVDLSFEDEMEYSWQSHKLKFKAITGHSKGSSFIFLDDKYIFSGDSILKEYPIILRFPRGSKKDYVEKTIPYIEALDRCVVILPGHGKYFVLKELFEGDKFNVEFR